MLCCGSSFFCYFSIESQYYYFYMDVVRDENLIPWRSIAFEVHISYVCMCFMHWNIICIMK